MSKQDIPIISLSGIRDKSTETFLRGKPRTNPRQTQDNPRTESETDKNKNPGQTPDNTRTTKEETLKPKTNHRQTTDSLKTQPKTKHRTDSKTNPGQNLGQTQDKPRTKVRVRMLNGLKLSILLIIFESCLLRGSKESGPLTIDYISTTKQGCMNPNSVRRIISRLIDDGFLIRGEFVPGRLGCTEYIIPDDVYSDILIMNNFSHTSDKPQTNPGQNLGQTPDKPRTQPQTTASSSSSSLDNTNKTTTNWDELPEDWKLIEISKLESIGFKRGHIKQAYDKGGSTPEEVQDVIWSYAYDLENAGNEWKAFQKTPVGRVMGCILNGYPYTPVALGYENPEIKRNRERLERLRKESESIKAMEEEIMSLEYEKWLRDLSDDQIKEVFPEYKGTMNPMAIGILKTHYKENVFRSDYE